MPCATAARAALAYKRLCEQSDSRLRQIFRLHLGCVRVKVEKIDVSDANDHEEIRPLETHWLEDKASESSDGCSVKSALECDDDWAMESSEGDTSEKHEKLSPTSEPTAPESDLSHNTAVRVKHTDESRHPNVVNNLLKILKDGKCESGSWVCKYCNKCLRNRRSWKLHVRRHIRMAQYAKPSESNTVKVSRTPIVRLKKENITDDGIDEDVKLVERAQCVNGRWVCEICTKTLADRATLKLHIRVHLGIGLLKCDLCPKSFAKKSFLQFHMKSHEARDFPCPKCDSVLNSRRALRDHTADIHKEAKTERTFMCEICSKVFNRINTLNQHRLTHSDEKRFKCEICQQKLRTKGSLQ